MIQLQYSRNAEYVQWVFPYGPAAKGVVLSSIHVFPGWAKKKRATSGLTAGWF